VLREYVEVLLSVKDEKSKTHGQNLQAILDEIVNGLPTL
jgi:hypothetical protein